VARPARPLHRDDRDVPLIWFVYRDPHTVIAGHGATRSPCFSSPPEADEASAARAMTMAAAPGNSAGLAGILKTSGARS